MGRQPWSHRTIVEDCRSLSSYRVKEWRSRIQQIGGAEVLPLSYYVGDQLVSYSVELDTTRCNYGAKRYWFLCPICKKRVAKIHLPPGRKYFACRACHFLTYRSCKEHDARVDEIIKNPHLAVEKMKNPTLTDARLVLDAHEKMLEKRKKRLFRR